MIVEFTRQAEKSLSKMDPHVADNLLRYIENHLATLDDPRSEGRALTGEWSGYWRYRYKHYRLICEIVDAKLLIVVVRIGHRREVYD